MSKISAGSSPEDGVPAEGDAMAWNRRVGRQRERRLGTDELWRRLDDLATDSRSTVTNGARKGQALKSKRTRTELLEATISQMRRLMAPGALERACTTQAVAPGAFEQDYSTQAMAWGALEQAYTMQAGAGIIAIELRSGKIAYQSPSFQHLTSWIPVEARGNIRMSMDSPDGENFQSFCQSVVRDVGEPYRGTFWELDKVVGRSITVRFFTRAPGPPGLQNPAWLLMVRTVNLTLVGVQPRQLGESPAAGMRVPFFGQTRFPEAIGVFTADLSGGTPQQWTLQVAHVRYLLDCDLASGTYDMDTANVKPLEHIATLFNYRFLKEEGGGDSMFARAASKLEYAATSALHMAQRSATWVTRKALRITHQWTSRLNEDDTVAVSLNVFMKLFGGLSTSISMDYVAGKVGFSHGGLDALLFVADPEQPLDGYLRATLVRIAAAKARGAIDVDHPFVYSLLWGGGNVHMVGKQIGFESLGKKRPSVVEDDVHQLFEKLKVSPGAGVLSDGYATIRVGQSDAPSIDSPRAPVGVEAPPSLG